MSFSLPANNSSNSSNNNSPPSVVTLAGIVDDVKALDTTKDPALAMDAFMETHETPFVATEDTDMWGALTAHATTTSSSKAPVQLQQQTRAMVASYLEQTKHVSSLKGTCQQAHQQVQHTHTVLKQALEVLEKDSPAV